MFASAAGRPRPQGPALPAGGRGPASLGSLPRGRARGAAGGGVRRARRLHDLLREPLLLQRRRRRRRRRGGPPQAPRPLGSAFPGCAGGGRPLRGALLPPAERRLRPQPPAGARAAAGDAPLRPRLPRRLPRRAGAVAAAAGLLGRRRAAAPLPDLPGRVGRLRRPPPGALRGAGPAHLRGALPHGAGPHDRRPAAEPVALIVCRRSPPKQQRAMFSYIE